MLVVSPCYRMDPTLESSPLLWPLLESRLHPSEREHVKRLLGWRVVDQNAELLEELETRRTLFFDLREQRQQHSQAEDHGDKPHSAAASIGRQILVQQIDFFVSRLRRASYGGAQASTVGGGAVRPSTASSRNLRPNTAGSRGSGASTGSGGGTAGLSAIGAAAQEAVEVATEAAAASAASSSSSGGTLSVLSSGSSLEDAARVLRGALAAETRALTAETARVEALLVALADGADDGEALEDELLRGGGGAHAPAGFGACFATAEPIADGRASPSLEGLPGEAALAAAALPPEPGPGAPLEELRAYKAALQARWLAVEAAQGQSEQRDAGGGGSAALCSSSGGARLLGGLDGGGGARRGSDSGFGLEEPWSEPPQDRRSTKAHPMVVGGACASVFAAAALPVAASRVASKLHGRLAAGGAVRPGVELAEAPAHPLPPLRRVEVRPADPMAASAAPSRGAPSLAADNSVREGAPVPGAPASKLAQCLLQHRELDRDAGGSLGQRR